MCGGSRPSKLKKKNRYPLTLRRVGAPQVYPVGWAGDSGTQARRGWLPRTVFIQTSNNRAELQDVRPLYKAGREFCSRYVKDSGGDLESDGLEELSDIVGDLLVEAVQLRALLTLQSGVTRHGL